MSISNTFLVSLQYNNNILYIYYEFIAISR